MPFSAQAAAVFRASSGETVLESISAAPFFNAPITPFLPHSTSSSAGGSLTMVISTSACAAASAGFAARFAPAATRSSAFEAVRFHTTSGNPAFSRFMPIGLPIRPSPINPTVGFIPILLENLDDRKFHAMAKRIDALSAHAYFVAKAENELFAFAARCAVWFADDGMIALAEKAALAGGFFQPVDAHQAFHKYFYQLDEESEFLHGNNQRVIFLAEMAFHELRGLPIHQLAFGAIGAALGFGTFRSDFF